MNIQHHTTPEKLERYSFIWSEVRLLVAALALFLGGVPPVVYFIGASSLVISLLKIAWLISGAASGYLLYRWWSHQTVFGGKNKYDTAAFFVLVVSGINLGLTGLLNNNIGMSIFPSKLMFLIAGVIYLAAAYHLYKRWKAHEERLF